jgi:hypothetical protein
VAELARDAEARERAFAARQVAHERQRAEELVQHARSEEQELAAQLRADLDVKFAKVSSVVPQYSNYPQTLTLENFLEVQRAELQREKDSGVDLSRRLRQAEEELITKDHEMRASEVQLRIWAQQEIREAREALDAECARERDWGSRQVQEARQEERDLAERELQRLRDDMGALSDELIRERHQRQEYSRSAESKLASSARALQQLEARLEEECRRLGAAGGEAQEASIRAINAEQALRKLQADFRELEHERQLATHAAEDARREAQDARRKLEDIQRAERERERALAELQEAARLRESSDNRTMDILQRQEREAAQARLLEISSLKTEVQKLRKEKEEAEDTMDSLQRQLADLKQSRREKEVAEEREKEVVEGRQQLRREKEVAEERMVQQLRREKELAEETRVEISALQSQIRLLQKQVKEGAHDEESEKSTSRSVRSDARLMSAPPPTPFEKRDLAAALESQRERAIEAEEELRIMTGRAREAERRAREAEELVRKHRDRTRDAEEEARVLRERVRNANDNTLASRGEGKRESLDGQRECRDGQSRRVSTNSLAEAVLGEGERDKSEGERDKERLARALERVQAKSKECARLQSEVGQLEEEAETLRQGEKERERLLQAKSRDCARLEAEVLRMQDELDALREKQCDIDREADMVAELLLQYETSTNLSATALVKEALAHRDATSLSATALVRDALSHHVKEGRDVAPRNTDLVDLLRESIRSMKNSPARGGGGEGGGDLASCKSAATSPVPPRTVSFAHGVDQAGCAGSGSVSAEGKSCARLSAPAAELSRENSALQKQVEAMKRKVSDIQEELDAAVREREEIHAKIRNIELAADRDIDTNLRISISEANRRVAEVQAQLASATAERDEARRVMQDLKDMMGDVLQRHSQDMQQQHAQFAAENQRHKKDADELAASLRHEVEALRRRVEALQAQNNELQQWKDSCERNRDSSQAGKITEALKEAEEIRQSNSNLRVERTNLLTERQALMLRSERLALERENAHAEIERLKSKVDDLEAKHAAAREQLTSHCNRFDGMLLQARKVWQCQLDEAEQQQIQGRGKSSEGCDVERAELLQNIQRLRECNRLLILELEDTRSRLLDERRRRHAAECTAVSATSASQVAAAAAAAAVAGHGHTGTSKSTTRKGIKLLMPPVEDTPSKKLAPTSACEEEASIFACFTSKAKPPTRDSTVSGNAAREQMPLVFPQFVSELVGNATKDSTVSGNVARESAGFACQEQDFRHAQTHELETHELRDDEHFSDQEGAEEERGEDEEEQQREDDRGTPFSSPHPMLPLWVHVLKKQTPIVALYSKY